jgi:hypothetical protein
MATPVSAMSSTPHTGGGHTGQSVQTAPRSLAPPVPAAKSASAGHQQPLSFGFGGGNKDASAGTRGGTRVTRGARGAASGQSSAFAQDDPPPPYRNRRPRTAGSTFGGGSNGACEDIARAWNVSIVWCRQHSMLRLYCTLSPFAFVSSMFNVQRSDANTPPPALPLSPVYFARHVARSKFVAARPTKPGFRWQRPSSGKKRVVVSTRPHGELKIYEPSRLCAPIARYDG